MSHRTSGIQRSTQVVLCAAFVALTSACGSSHRVATAPAVVRAVTDVAAPTHLAVKVIGASAVITWDAPKGLSVPLKDFKFYLDQTKPVVLGPRATSRKLTGLVAGSEHYVQVVAFTAHDQSLPVGVTFQVGYAPGPVVTEAASATATQAPAPVIPEPTSPPTTSRPVITPPQTVAPASPQPLTHDLGGFLEGSLDNPGVDITPCNDPLTWRPGSELTLTDDTSRRVLASTEIGSCEVQPAGGPYNQQTFGFGFSAAPLTANMHLHLGNASWPLTLTSLINDLNYQFVLAESGTTPSAFPSSNGPDGGGCFNMGDISC